MRITISGGYIAAVKFSVANTGPQPVAQLLANTAPREAEVEAVPLVAAFDINDGMGPADGMNATPPPRAQLPDTTQSADMETDPAASGVWKWTTPPLHVRHTVILE